ncbi:transposase [Candidatus Dojkabacteria bacterium]|nr:transposase [Candidatus Dojkabacteria bacterium]
MSLFFCRQFLRLYSHEQPNAFCSEFSCRTLRSEWAGEISEIETFENLEKFVKDKIIYYNERRLHTSIVYTTPKKFTKSRLRNLDK